jgi:hypothetical protein
MAACDELILFSPPPPGAPPGLQVSVRKGDTIGGFLKAVREQLAPQFRELRAVSVDNMMYVKVGDFDPAKHPVAVNTRHLHVDPHQTCPRATAAPT